MILLEFIIAFREGFYTKCKSGELLMRGGECKSEKQLIIIRPKVVATQATGMGLTVRSP